MNKEILSRVREMFANLTDTDAEITEESELMEDLEISSMDVLYVISCLEEEFKIKVPEKLLRKVVTVGDVAEIVTDLVNG